MYVLLLLYVLFSMSCSLSSSLLVLCPFLSLFSVLFSPCSLSSSLLGHCPLLSLFSVLFSPCSLSSSLSSSLCLVLSVLLSACFLSSSLLVSCLFLCLFSVFFTMSSSYNLQADFLPKITLNIWSKLYIFEHFLASTLQNFTQNSLRKFRPKTSENFGQKPPKISPKIASKVHKYLCQNAKLTKVSNQFLRPQKEEIR